ncbi:MAG: hypothetical protein K1X89_14495 [Myxococcaceae bacterium]|nr:hypothetical protein [Myxococcaceae bacterium]
MLWAFLAFAVSAAPAPAEASLAEGVRLYESLEFERANVALSGGLAQKPEASVELRLRLYRGVVLAQLGRDADADADFSRALTLDPLARLPVAVAPKLAAHFETLRRALPRPQVTPPPAPEVVEVPVPEAPARVHSPLFWASTAGAAAAAGTGAVLLVLSNQRAAALRAPSAASLSYADATSLRRSGETLGTWGLIASGVAVAAAATAVVLHVTAGPVEATASVAPGAGGAALTVGGVFP